MVIWTEGLYDLTEAWRAISDLAAALLQNVSLKEYDWLEFFAGRANATHAVRLRGGIGARFDLEYWCPGKAGSSNYHDITSPSGFWPRA